MVDAWSKQLFSLTRRRLKRYSGDGTRCHPLGDGPAPVIHPTVVRPARTPTRRPSVGRAQGRRLARWHLGCSIVRRWHVRMRRCDPPPGHRQEVGRAPTFARTTSRNTLRQIRMAPRSPDRQPVTTGTLMTPLHARSRLDRRDFPTWINVRHVAVGKPGLPLAAERRPAWPQALSVLPGVSSGLPTRPFTRRKTA